MKSFSRPAFSAPSILGGLAGAMIVAEAASSLLPAGSGLAGGALRMAIVLAAGLGFIVLSRCKASAPVAVANAVRFEADETLFPILNPNLTNPDLCQPNQ